VIHSDDINLRRLLAKCRNCHALLNVPSQAGGDEDTEEEAAGAVPGDATQVEGDEPDEETEDEAAGAVPGERPAAQKPPGWQVDESGAQLRITWSWRTGSTFAHALFFFLFWGGGGAWLMTTDFEPAAAARGYPLLFVALGAVLVSGTYTLLARLLNHTEVRADAEGLAVRHGPLPWPGNRSLPAGRVQQLYCREVIRDREQGTHFYEVHAVTTDGADVPLLANLPNVAQALYVEQRVERQLGIPDRPVGGELPRGGG
jgi:hypothetical protein